MSAVERRQSRDRNLIVFMCVRCSTMRGGLRRTEVGRGRNEVVNSSNGETFVLVRVWERGRDRRRNLVIKINGAANRQNIKLRHLSFSGFEWSRCRNAEWC